LEKERKGKRRKKGKQTKIEKKETNLSHRFLLQKKKKKMPGSPSHVGDVATMVG